MSRCECQPGRFLCKTAESLWLAAGVAYLTAKQYGDWAQYDRAKADYEQHVGLRPPKHRPPSIRNPGK